MRNLLIIAMTTLVIMVGSGTVSAIPLQPDLSIEHLLEPEPVKQEPEQQAVRKITVVEGDYLDKIAEANQTTWERLWQKNLDIKHPDVIAVGLELTIPEATEKLKPRELPVIVLTAPTRAVFKPQAVSSGGVVRGGAAESATGLTGSIGRVKHYGNCVNEPGVNSPRNGGNPISWAVLSRTPTIGATALWNYNHTGIISGIYEGGQYVEVRHQNYRGDRTKFHISEFRGYR